MKEINRVRERMAEQGVECTPKQVKSIMMKLGELHVIITSGPSFEDMGLKEKQKLRQDLATSGEEVTLGELDSILDLINKIKNVPIQGDA
jgi:Asp-tRNA(Asn)/Glu-tRNA(Gln) amidotransferase C subunit